MIYSNSSILRIEKRTGPGLRPGRPAKDGCAAFHGVRLKWPAKPRAAGSVQGMRSGSTLLAAGRDTTQCDCIRFAGPVKGREGRAGSAVVHAVEKGEAARFLSYPIEIQNCNEILAGSRRIILYHPCIEELRKGLQCLFSSLGHNDICAVITSSEGVYGAV